MTNTSIELREQRSRLIAEARQILDANAKDNNGTLPPEDQTRWDAAMADVDRLADQIAKVEREEHQSKLEAELRESTARKPAEQRNHFASSRPVSRQERAEYAQASWIKRQIGGSLSVDELAAAETAGINLSNRTQRFDLPETRTGLVKGTNSAGGYTVPTDFVSMLDVALKYYCPIRNFCRVERTSDGRDLTFPQRDATSNLAAIVAENGTINESDATYSNVVLHAYKFANLITYSRELAQDSVINIAADVANTQGEAIARGQEAYFCGNGTSGHGSGSSEPKSLVAVSTQGVNLASGSGAVTLTWDNIMDLINSVDFAYAASPSAAFVMNRSTAATLRKIKDTSGRYIWDATLVRGLSSVPNELQFDKVLGYPVVISNSVDAATVSGKKAIIFGDMSKFLIRDVREVEVRVANELYLATDMFGVFAVMRSDSNLIGPANCIRHLLT